MEYSTVILSWLDDQESHTPVRQTYPYILNGSGHGLRVHWARRYADMVIDSVTQVQLAMFLYVYPFLDSPMVISIHHHVMRITK